MRTRSLRSLARLHRWDLDQQRREIAELYRVRHELGEAMGTLNDMLVRELALSRTEGRPADFAAFAARIKTQQDGVAAHIVDIEARITAKQDEIADTFRDVKRYEVLEERQRQRQRAEAERREQATLDEIGIQGHHLRQSAAGE